MKNKKTDTAPRMEWWKKKNGKLDFAIIAKNGEHLDSPRQGFERWKGIEKNLKALFGMAGVQVILTKKELWLNDNFIPVIEIKK